MAGLFYELFKYTRIIKKFCHIISTIFFILYDAAYHPYLRFLSAGAKRSVILERES